MLVRITNSCSMNCSHCMIGATPDGEHMSFETFSDALEFSSKYDPLLLFISGGEPTDHPKFIDFIKLAKVYQQKNGIIMILVASNGLFLENGEYSKEILSLGVHFQITNDPRYYPRRVKKIDHPNVVYEDTIRLLSPMGRAVTNNLPIQRQSPQCFNFRSACDHYQDVGVAIKHLRTLPNPKMCCPSINADGSISMGESSSCYKIGSVKSTRKELIDNVTAMKCGKCGTYKNLSGIPKDKWESWER